MERTTLLSLSFMLALVTQVSAQQQPCIEFHGNIHSGFGDPGMSHIVLAIGDQPAETVPVSPSGAFRVYVPEGAQAVMSFVLSDHVRKSVVVDGQDAFVSNSNKKKNKRIAFDVMLNEIRPDEEAVEQIVGRIRFLRGSGLMKVEHLDEEGTGEYLPGLAASF
ncbi:MAG: hypothetical protein KDB88_05495 [Flavobacteriales bacterium]|nr:hypothetical protein [Flavobacteriales bacterium]